MQPEHSRLQEKPRILVAEDDSELRQLIVLTLSRDGYEVVEAENGRRLVEQIAKLWMVDAIISDVRMPGRNGLDVLSCFRHAGWTTPFVLITAFGSEALHEEARRLGASAVFDKPFDLDDLRHLVRTLAPTSPDTPGKILRFGGSRRRDRERHRIH